MNIQAVQGGLSDPRAKPMEAMGNADQNSAFDSILRGVNQNDRNALQEAASRLVSTAFVMPVLESLNQSPLRPTQGAFALGSAEKRFTPLLHQEFADRITQSANFGLIRSIVDRFKAHMEGVDHASA